MRQILNISLPEKMVKMIKVEVKEGGFASVSEFMRHLIRLYKTDQFLRDVKLSEKEFAEGKYKELKSLKDLM